MSRIFAAAIGSRGVRNGRGWSLRLITGLRSSMARARGSELVRHSMLVFAGLIAANILQFLFYSLVSRVVGVEAYGVVTSLFSATLLLATGPALVAGTVVARLAADLRAAGDDAKLRRLGDLATLATALVGGTSFAITALFAVPIAVFLHLAGTTPVIITGIVLGFSIAIPVQRGVMQGAERFGAFALSNILEAGPKAIFCPLLGMHWGANGALAGLAISVIVCSVYNALTLRRMAAQPNRLRLDVRRIAITSTNVAFAVLAVNALLFYDVILVRHYFSAETAGLYGAAALVGRAMYTVIAFIPTIVLPKASVRRSLGRRTVPLLIASVGAASAVVVVALAANFLAPTLVVSILAGRAFGAAGAFVLAYTFALGALALANVIAMYNIGLHRFDFVAPLVVIALGEIVTVSLWHRSVHDVLLVLCIGHTCAFVSTLVRFKSVVVRVKEATVSNGA